MGKGGLICRIKERARPEETDLSPEYLRATSSWISEKVVSGRKFDSTCKKPEVLAEELELYIRKRVKQRLEREVCDSIVLCGACFH